MDSGSDRREVASASGAAGRSRARAAPDRLRPCLILGGAASLALYAVLAALGDLRAHLGVYLAVNGVLFGLYVWVLFGIHRERSAAGSGEVGGDSGGAATSDSRLLESVPLSPSGPHDVDLAGDSGSVAHGQRFVGPLPHRPLASGTAWKRIGLQRIGPGAVVFVFAVLFRTVFVATPPSLSDDLHRYVWDGRVQASGKNPYRYAPEAEVLKDLRDAGWEKINHRDLKTAYPPASEILFLAAAAAGLRETGFKVLFCLFDLGVIVALGEVLRRTGQSPLAATVYAWNPLVVLEIASSGHSDPVGLCLVVVSVALIIGGHRALSIAAWMGAVLARTLPIAFAPIFLRRSKLRHLVLAAILVVIVVGPYASARRDLVSGLSVYAENWDYNSVVFPALRAVLATTVQVEWLKHLVTLFKDAIGDPPWCQILYRWVYPAPLARVLLLLALLAGVFEISFRAARIEREIFLATGLLLVLTPTLHPWYLVWIVAFASLEWSRPWLLFSGLAPLSYLSLRAGDGRVPLWLLAIEWGIPCAAALVLAARGKTRAR